MIKRTTPPTTRRVTRTVKTETIPAVEATATPAENAPESVTVPEEINRSLKLEDDYYKIIAAQLT